MSGLLGSLCLWKINLLNVVFFHLKTFCINCTRTIKFTSSLVDYFCLRLFFPQADETFGLHNSMDSIVTVL